MSKMQEKNPDNFSMGDNNMALEKQKVKNVSENNGLDI